MKGFSGAAGVAVLGGLVAMCAPVEATAGNIGYMNTCAAGGSAASAISAAGHTPVPVATLDSTTLSTLDGLVLSVCQFPGSTALDSAVQNGLRVMINTPSLYNGGVLPGDPSLSLLNTCNQNLSIAPGSPIATGPGGTLTDTSLDGNFLCSSVGSAAISSLPANSQPLVLDAQMPERAVAFAYPFGAGMVAVSMSQWMHVLPGGQYPGQPFDAGALTYYTNTVAWMMPGNVVPEATCASEGYTGTKLEWCKNICERAYTGSTLNMWIHRWVDRYRVLPYCAAPQPTLR